MLIALFVVVILLALRYFNNLMDASRHLDP